MNESVVEFPDRKVIEEEAGEWLIKLDGDNVPSTEELASLREWLSRSPVHREQLASLANFWDKMNVLTELAVPLGHPRRSFFENLRHTIPPIGRAAVVMVAIIIGIGVSLTYWSRPDPFFSSNGLYATAVGQQQSTTLSDGSVVILNTNSQIKVDYGNDYRDIRLLQGEAHFTVVKDSRHPFQVYAGNGRVQAVGTAFSVYLKADSIDVTVTEGKVALASFSRQNMSQSTQRQTQGRDVQPSGSNEIVGGSFVEALVTIKAGESATIWSGGDVNNDSTINPIETVEATEMTKRLSWRDGVLTFTGDPLEEVVDEISRYTTISITITDPDIRAMRIGGRFSIGETDAMFDALEANFGLRVTRLGHDRILISSTDEQ